MTTIGDIINGLRSPRGEIDHVNKNIVYNTKSEEYLNADPTNEYAYWDTIDWHPIPDKGIEILNELLLGMTIERQRLLPDTLLVAMVLVIQPEVEHLLIVPCIHFKKKGKRVKLDFVNAFRFDKVTV